MEAWVKVDDVSGVRSIMARGFGDSGGFLIWVQQGKLRARLYPSVGGNVSLESGNFQLTNDTWHHVAVSLENGTVRTFLDGVLDQERTTVISSSASFNSTDPFEIGVYNGNSARFGGEMADLRVIDGTAIYTENFSVPTATLGDYPPPPVRYYKTLATKYVEPIASYDFDSSFSGGHAQNDAIVLSNHSVGYFGSGNFTIDFWVNWGGGGTTKQIMSQKDPYDYAKQSWQIEADNGSLDFLRLFNNYAFSRIPLTYVNEHTWHHVSITRYGSDLIISNYNSSTGTTTQRTEPIGGTVREVNYPVHIGSSVGGFDRYQGKLADIRISHAAEYHTNGVYSYTPPTAGLPVTPDTVALIRSKAEGETGTSSAGIGFVDYSGNTDMTLQYDPTIDTSDTIPPQS